MTYDLFDTPSNRVLGALPSGIAGQFRQLLDQPLATPAELDRCVVAYLAKIEARSAATEFVDVRLARSIASSCRTLAKQLESLASEEERQLAQAAVLYFLLEDDHEGDMGSAIGFDDDALVIQLTLRELGLETSH